MSQIKKLFVTVGTTSFDKLIETISSPAVLEVLKLKNYGSILLQIGRGEFEPSKILSYGDGSAFDFYRYKTSIIDDVNSADLVISHAGAGSCLEVLAANKPLIIVVNEDLMDNHQMELASQLHEDGHALYCTCSTLQSTLKNMDLTRLRPFPRGEPEKFAKRVDQLMGFCD